MYFVPEGAARPSGRAAPVADDIVTWFSWQPAAHLLHFAEHLLMSMPNGPLIDQTFSSHFPLSQHVRATPPPMPTGHSQGTSPGPQAETLEPPPSASAITPMNRAAAHAATPLLLASFLSVFILLSSTPVGVALAVLPSPAHTSR